MSLTEKYVPKVAATVGNIELVLNDVDGSVPGMTARGMADVHSADGSLLTSRRGDPQQFMPPAWRLKAKELLDELRAAVADRLL